MPPNNGILRINFLVALFILVASMPSSVVHAKPKCDVPSPPPACNEPEEPVVEHDPFGTIDEMARRFNLGSPHLRIRGWAIDPDTVSPVDIQVFGDNTLITTLSANQSRPDVGAVHSGFGDQHGYDFSIPIQGQAICLFALNQGPGAPRTKLGCWGVTRDAFGAVDEITWQSGNVHIRGWVIDPDTDSSIDIEISIDGALIRTFTAGQNRPDVGIAFPGYGDFHGFDLVMPAGGRMLCIDGVKQGLETVRVRLGCQEYRVLGFADIHNHQFANLAFGGKLFVGRAFGPIEEALSPSLDRGNHGPDHFRDSFGTFLAKRGPALPEIYPNDGFPYFDGWPRISEVNHQKVYQDWLYRAVQGGLRLIVMFAEDNPTLCKLVSNDGRNCDNEMATIDLQLDAAYAMQEYIDQQAGGSGQGWYRIVKNPAEAREVIQEGKLAVVLGIETAHLFNCHYDEPCEWMAPLAKYWGKGVRHFFPIHQDNTAFGGASYFLPTVQRERGVIESILLPNPLDPIEFLAPYEFDLAPCSQYEVGALHKPAPVIPPLFIRGWCNQLGLTQTGIELLTELMRAGALIDVDHMSDLSFSDTLSLVEQFGYPVVASHVGFNEINHQAQNHEGQLTLSELERIQSVGGMVGLITGQGTLEEVGTYSRPEGKNTIVHICGGTSETFAQAYYYALDHAPGMSLALGTDFNAPLIQPGPRFDANKCPGGLDKDLKEQKWEQRLRYPFLARAIQQDYPVMTTGYREFDFNTYGLANAGLFPDFLADLEVLGMSPEELDPVFHSAEGYIRVWERAIDASNRIRRRMDVAMSPNILTADHPSNFTIHAIDRYSKEQVRADVFLNNEFVGKTNQTLSRTFVSTCHKTCYIDSASKEKVCESEKEVPHLIVKVSVPNYLDVSIKPQFEVEDVLSCGP